MTSEIKYIISKHAQKRLAQRKIKLEWVTATLEKPDILENDIDDPSAVHAIKCIPEKGMKQLRVIYNETTEPVTIITAYFG